MTTVNIPINGNWTKVAGQIFSNPNMISVEYIVVNKDTEAPASTLKGTYITYKSQADLREFSSGDIYFRTENSSNLDLTVTSGFCKCC